MPTCIPHATALRPADASLRNHLLALGGVVTSTTGGTHKPTSYHYCGQAIDLAPSPVVWGYLYARRVWFAELFGPTGLAGGGLYHSGSKFTDPALQAQHQNHIHVAYTGTSYPPPGGVLTTPAINSGPPSKPCLPGGGCPPGYFNQKMLGVPINPAVGCKCIRSNQGGPSGDSFGNPLSGISSFFSNLPRYLELGAGGLLMLVGLGVMIVGASGVASGIPGVGQVVAQATPSARRSRRESAAGEDAKLEAAGDRATEKLARQTIRRRRAEATEEAGAIRAQSQDVRKAAAADRAGRVPAGQSAGLGAARSGPGARIRHE